MTGGNGPLGRRDNGLQATSYAVVAEIDPRVGDHLLEVLADRGIAAYLKPTATLPHPPVDRLFVDRESLTAAARLVADEIGSNDPAPSPDDPVPSEDPDGSTTIAFSVASTTVAPPPGRDGEEFETAWASIVAGFDHSAPSGQRPWPSSEDVTGGPDASPKKVPRFHDERIERPEPSILDGLDTFGADLPDEDEEDYSPPPPPPLPRIALVTVVGVLGIVVGFLAVVRPDWFATLVPAATAEILGGAALVFGTILLVGRLRSGSDEDGEDDGARI